MAKTSDYKLGEFTFPRGWFVVAESTAIGKAPYNTRYFGEDVVIYRGASGAVAMIGAYCAHMGTHLGKSKTSWTVVSGSLMDGDCIRCPFHGWRYGPDGKCNNIPYFDGPIPEKARVRSWPVVERYGIIFCWNDPEGLAPDIEVPSYPEWDDPRWLRWDGLNHIGDMNTHPIEVVDNNSDIRHLDWLHGSSVQCYENEVNGPYLHQRQSSRPKGIDPNNPLGSNTFSTDVYYAGPGILCSRYLEAHMAQMIAHTPIDDGVVRLWQTTMKRSSKPAIDDEDRAQLRRINETMVHGLTEDMEVWANKRPALQVMQVPTDGPFGQSRIWYSQFYNPRAKSKDILARVQGMHTVRGTPTFPKAAAE